MIEDFIQKLEAEFEDLEPGKLKPESNFRDAFEWNSINALILMTYKSRKRLTIFSPL
jgi:acyl carrier protein